jgi:hypothetical protein
MGVDLTVMASHFRERHGELLPTAVLRFDRDAALFGQLAAEATPCLVRALPEGVRVGSYEDDGLRYTVTDRYGDRLTYTTPSEIRALVVPDDVAAWNRAIIAFLLALPEETRIVLFWC